MSHAQFSLTFWAYLPLFGKQGSFTRERGMDFTRTAFVSTYEQLKRLGPRKHSGSVGRQWICLAVLPPHGLNPGKPTEADRWDLHGFDFSIPSSILVKVYSHKQISNKVMKKIKQLDSSLTIQVKLIRTATDNKATYI